MHLCMSVAQAHLYIGPTTTMPTSTSTDHPTPSPTTGSISSVTCTPTSIFVTVTPTMPVSSGVLGIYRITLWIIVLTLTILSTAITSLGPGFLQS